jgi:hypothetical protein
MIHQSVQILNENQGAVMAVLTAIYVVATLVLVGLSKRQAQTNQQTLDFLAQVERSRKRPYVIFEIVYTDLVAYASIRNTGISPALDVRISVTPRLQWDKDSEEIAFIKTGLAFLAPNREVSEPLGVLENMNEMYPEFRFAGIIRYRDSEGKSYEEPFAIDLNYIKTAGVISPKTVADELQGISKSLEQIKEVLSEPMLMRLIPESEFQRQQEAKRQERKLRNEALQAAIAEAKQKNAPTARTSPKAEDIAALE